MQEFRDDFSTDITRQPYRPGALGPRLERRRFLIQRTAAVEEFVVLLAVVRGINPAKIAQVGVLVLSLLFHPLLSYSILVLSETRHIIRADIIKSHRM